MNFDKFQTKESDHKFFTFMSLATFFAVTIGFGNFYGRHLIAQNEPIATVIHIHGAVFLTWILTFVLQVYFAAKNKISLHMRVGKVAILIAAVMLVSGVLTSLYAAKTGHMGIPGVEFPTVEGFLLLNLSSLTVFIILSSAGWVYRNKPQFHKRFMLMATVAGLAPPGISRLPGLSGTTPAIAGTVLVFILLGPLYDLKFHKKIHSAYIYSLPLVIFILPPVVTILSATSVWISISRFLVGL
jgi:hypothetical protein